MLILAGLEPEGRAGLLADVAAVREQGAHPVAVATALTAQGERTFRVQPVPVATIAAQVCFPTPSAKIRLQMMVGPID